jgi:hypothetical protein
MLQFQPFEAEMARFAEHIMPRFRAGRLDRRTSANPSETPAQAVRAERDR